MSALDNARKAMEASDLADRHGREYAADRELKRGSVLATIALAEEQRTANLIAAFERDAISAPAADLSTAERHAYWNGIADDITKRLGLA